MFEAMKLELTYAFLLVTESQALFIAQCWYLSIQVFLDIINLLRLCATMCLLALSKGKALVVSSWMRRHLRDRGSISTPTDLPSHQP